MLLSLLLSLTPTTSTRLDGFYGREAQAWLLGQIARHDPELAEALHQEEGSGRPKPFTVSSLIVPEAGRRETQGETWLIPGNDCLLRITSLEARLTELLLKKMLPNLPPRVRLKWTEFRVLGPARENQWWGETTFAELARCANEGKNGVSVTLEFASPTAFRSGGVDMSLPTPDQVWRSLWWRWNAFAPEALHIDPLWPNFAGSCLVVSDFQLRSMKVLFKQGEKGAATGCTGRATYRLLPEKHCGDLAPFRPGAELVLRSLASFALYSGVGHHTTMGLGQARWIGQP